MFVPQTMSVSQSYYLYFQHIKQTTSPVSSLCWLRAEGITWLQANSVTFTWEFKTWRQAAWIVGAPCPPSCPMHRCPSVSLSQRRDPTLHHGVGVALSMLPVLQTAYSHSEAFTPKPTILSGTQWKLWCSVLALENNNWLRWTYWEMLYLNLKLHDNQADF